MGVWAAHHSRLDTLVAVKLIDGEGQESGERLLGSLARPAPR